MLKNKQVILFAILIVLLASISYVFSLTVSDNRPLYQNKLNVQLLWQDDDLDCQTKFNANEENRAWIVEQLQFFISDIEFGSAEIGWQRAQLTHSAYQSNGTVLLGKNCRETSQLGLSNHNENWMIEFASDINLSAVSAMRFTVGVPFSVNHLNPISQKSPLNSPSMFWVWQTGHKFIRLELAAENQPWLFHLGSTGCKSASVMRAPERACHYPNRFTFELPLTQVIGNNFVLAFDLAALLNNVDLNPLSSCQSERDKLSCQQLFQNLSIAERNTDAVSLPSVFKLLKTKHTSKGMSVE